MIVFIKADGTVKRVLDTDAPRVNDYKGHFQGQPFLFALYEPYGQESEIFVITSFGNFYSKTFMGVNDKADSPGAIRFDLVIGERIINAGVMKSLNELWDFNPK